MFVLEDSLSNGAYGGDSSGRSVCDVIKEGGSLSREDSQAGCPQTVPSMHHASTCSCSVLRHIDRLNFQTTSICVFTIWHRASRGSQSTLHVSSEAAGGTEGGSGC